MVENCAPIKRRALQVAEYYGFSVLAFSKKISASKGNFNKKALESELGGTHISQILTNFPQISPDWLLLGEGDMLRQNSKIESETAPKESGGSVVPAEKFMEAQDKIIKLQEEVNRLSVENVLLKRTDASTPSSTAATGTDQ